MKFDAVILAGGNSSRMGRDKAWLEVEGQSLLARQIQVAREVGASEVFVSGRAGVDYSGLNFQVLRDRLVDAGPLGGIERALDQTTTSLLLVLAVDMPRMTAEFLHQMLSRCRKGIGVVPRLNGNIEPLNAVYPKITAGLIEELFPAPTERGSSNEAIPVRVKSPSATAFAEKCVVCGMATFIDVTESEAHFFTNWNSPQDTK